MKRCPKCKETLPLSDFGVVRARPDGLNLYCKRCVRQKVAIQRQKTREYLAARKLTPPVKRKPNMTARGMKRACRREIRKAFTVPEKVLVAINGGAGTQKQIWSLTAIPKDAVADALAVLVLDRGVVKVKPLPLSERESWYGDNWQYIAA